MSGQVITGHPYSVTDIQHYLEGRLSVAEMHAIESAALDDPFLADAIDGVSENLHVQPPGYFDADMDDLKKRLQERIASKRSVIVLSSNSTWWKAAAAVIIVLAASAVTFNYFVRNSAPPPDIVLNNSTAKADSSVVNSEPKSVAEAGDQTEHEKNNSSASRIAAAKSAAKKLPGIVAYETPDKDSVNYHDGLVSKQQVHSDSIALAYAPVHASGDSTSATIEETLQGKVAGVVVVKASPGGIVLLKGRITGLSRDAIPGAIVSIGRDKKSTAADAQGNFTLPVNRADTVVDVLVTAVGYDSKSISLHPAENTETIVQLQSSSVALNEVVVMGLGASRRKSKSFASETKKSNAFKDAAPVEGWDAFRKYIDENKQVISPDSVLKGNEVIAFNVDAQGNLSHFLVSQSISPAHDAKITGLLKTGPKWKLLSGKKARVTLSISY